MYEGSKVRLRAYKKDDAELAHRFMNDPDVTQFLNPNVPLPITYEEEMDWYEDIRERKSEGIFDFAIETLEDNKYIGGCGVNNVAWKNRTATVGIFIGDKNYWGKGYGTDAMKLLIKFVFDEMNVNKIKLNTFSFNERAIKSYTKCGFKIEGTLRQEIFRKGKYFDEIIMGLLNEERI